MNTKPNGRHASPAPGDPVGKPEWLPFELGKADEWTAKYRRDPMAGEARREGSVGQ
jgi:hypothetical protein